MKNLIFFMPVPNAINEPVSSEKYSRINQLLNTLFDHGILVFSDEAFLPLFYNKGLLFFIGGREDQAAKLTFEFCSRSDGLVLMNEEDEPSISSYVREMRRQDKPIINLTKLTKEDLSNYLKMVIEPKKLG